MEIKHIDGSVLETDKLPDIQAMTLEKVENFRIFCLENKIPFFLAIDATGCGEKFMYFWNALTRKNYDELSIDENGRLSASFNFIFHGLNYFITSVTNGQLSIRSNEN